MIINNGGEIETKTACLNKVYPATDPGGQLIRKDCAPLETKLRGSHRGLKSSSERAEVTEDFANDNSVNEYSWRFA